MATLYAVQRAKAESSVPQLGEQGYKGAAIKALCDSYSLTADTASNDIIKCGKLPKGARVIDVRLIFTDLDGTGGTLDIGWAASADSAESADDDGFADEIDVTSAGVYSMFTSQYTRPGMNKVFAGECEVQIKFSGDCDATSGSVQIMVLYCID